MHVKNQVVYWFEVISERNSTFSKQHRWSRYKVPAILLSCNHSKRNFTDWIKWTPKVQKGKTCVDIKCH